uniref:Uncharacterized protein n=1 Tax=Glossina palpalis gambiensis TaxID=67801 RepID=A0A1B0BNK1_9MUSC
MQLHLTLPHEDNHSIRSSLAGTSMASHGSSETFSMEDNNIHLKTANALQSTPQRELLPAFSNQLKTTPTATCTSASAINESPIKSLPAAAANMTMTSRNTISNTPDTTPHQTPVRQVNLVIKVESPIPPASSSTKSLSVKTLTPLSQPPLKDKQNLYINIP